MGKSRMNSKDHCSNCFDQMFRFLDFCYKNTIFGSKKRIIARLHLSKLAVAETILLACPLSVSLCQKYLGGKTRKTSDTAAIPSLPLSLSLPLPPFSLLNGLNDIIDDDDIHTCSSDSLETRKLSKDSSLKILVQSCLSQFVPSCRDVNTSKN